jgi:hypothetical protein
MYTLFLVKGLVEVDEAQYAWNLLVELLVAAELDDVGAVLDLDDGLCALGLVADEPADDLGLVQNRPVDPHDIVAVLCRGVGEPRDEHRGDRVVHLLAVAFLETAVLAVVSAVDKSSVSVHLYN